MYGLGFKCSDLGFTCLECRPQGFQVSGLPEER